MAKPYMAQLPGLRRFVQVTETETLPRNRKWLREDEEALKIARGMKDKAGIRLISRRIRELKSLIKRSEKKLAKARSDIGILESQLREKM